MDLINNYQSMTLDEIRDEMEQFHLSAVGSRENLVWKLQDYIRDIQHYLKDNEIPWVQLPDEVLSHRNNYMSMADDDVRMELELFKLNAEGSIECGSLQNRLNGCIKSIQNYLKHNQAPWGLQPSDDENSSDDDDIKEDLGIYSDINR